MNRSFRHRLSIKNVIGTNKGSRQPKDSKLWTIRHRDAFPPGCVDVWFLLQLIICSPQEIVWWSKYIAHRFERTLPPHMSWFDLNGFEPTKNSNYKLDWNISTWQYWQLMMEWQSKISNLLYFSLTSRSSMRISRGKNPGRISSRKENPTTIFLT